MVIGKNDLYPTLLHQEVTFENQSLVPEVFLNLGFQSQLGICRSLPGCLSLALLCRGGAELLFDGVKKHQITLPGQEKPCEYRPSDSLLGYTDQESAGPLSPIQVGMVGISVAGGQAGGREITIVPFPNPLWDHLARQEGGSELQSL